MSKNYNHKNSILNDDELLLQSNSDKYSILNGEDEFPSDWVFLNDRSKRFAFELYPDNPEHIIIYCRLIDFCNTHYVRFAIVFHDKDVKRDGSPAKLHIHFYIYLSYVQSNSGLYKRPFLYGLGLDETFRFCIPISGEKNFIRYLLHYDQPDKYQYDITVLKHFNFDHNRFLGFFSTPRAKYKKQFSAELQAEDGFVAVIDLIDTMAYNGHRMTVQNLVHQVIKHGLYKHYKSNYRLIIDYFNEWKFKE